MKHINESTSNTNLADQLFEKFESALSSEHQQIVFKFFLAFMRFEFLLKYRCYIDNTGIVNWGQFTTQNKDDYDRWLDSNNDSTLTSVINYLNQQPPKKLIFESRKFVWKTPQNTFKRQLEILVSHIKIIRNNLFHGNKFIGADNGRNKELLEASLVIIDSFVRYLNEEDAFIEESY